MILLRLSLVYAATVLILQLSNVYHCFAIDRTWVNTMGLRGESTMQVVPLGFNGHVQVVEVILRTVCCCIKKIVFLD